MQESRKNILHILAAICFAAVLTALLLFITPSGLARADEEVKEIVKIENELEEKEKPEKEKASETKSINMNSLPVLSEEEFTEKCTCPQIGDCLKDKYLVVCFGFEDSYFDINLQSAALNFYFDPNDLDENDLTHQYMAKIGVDRLDFEIINYDNSPCFYFQFSSNVSDESVYTLTAAYENLFVSDSPLLLDNFNNSQSGTDDPTPDNPTPDEPTTPSSGNEPSGNNGSADQTTANNKIGLSLSGGLITVAIAGAVIIFIVRRKK